MNFILPVPEAAPVDLHQLHASSRRQEWVLNQKGLP